MQSNRETTPAPPPPPERPGWSSASKDRQPSKTPLYRELPPMVSFSWLLRFIDWLNGLLGADKPKRKRKETDEQMATLAELFDEVELGVKLAESKKVLRGVRQSYLQMPPDYLATERVLNQEIAMLQEYGEHPDVQEQIDLLKAELRDCEPLAHPSIGIDMDQE